eukprot:1162506-Prymnesium_polylepis.1
MSDHHALSGGTGLTEGVAEADERRLCSAVSWPWHLAQTQAVAPGLCNASLTVSRIGPGLKK